MKQIGQIFLFLLIVTFVSCKKRPEFPTTPEISFHSIEKKTYQTTRPGGVISKNDSVTISIYFKDGDGDLGRDDNSENNYFCQPFRKTENGYDPIICDTCTVPYTITKNGTFLNLNPDGRRGPLEGILRYGPSLLLNGVIRDTNHFVLRFEVYIKDNSGHTSNTIATSDIQLENYSDE